MAVASAWSDSDLASTADEDNEWLSTREEAMLFNEALVAKKFLDLSDSDQLYPETFHAYLDGSHADTKGDKDHGDKESVDALQRWHSDLVKITSTHAGQSVMAALLRRSCVQRRLHLAYLRDSERCRQRQSRRMSPSASAGHSAASPGPLAPRLALLSMFPIAEALLSAPGVDTARLMGGLLGALEIGLSGAQPASLRPEPALDEYVRFLLSLLPRSTTSGADRTRVIEAAVSIALLRASPLPLVLAAGALLDAWKSDNSARLNLGARLRPLVALNASRDVTAPESRMYEGTLSYNLPQYNGIACDAAYIYIDSECGVLKIGTGTRGTIQGFVYAPEDVTLQVPEPSVGQENVSKGASLCCDGRFLYFVVRRDFSSGAQPAEGLVPTVAVYVYDGLSAEASLRPLRIVELAGPKPQSATATAPATKEAAIPAASFERACWYSTGHQISALYAVSDGEYQARVFSLVGALTILGQLQRIARQIVLQESGDVPDEEKLIVDPSPELFDELSSLLHRAITEYAKGPDPALPPSQQPLPLFICSVCLSVLSANMSRLVESPPTTKLDRWELLSVRESSELLEYVLLELCASPYDACPMIISRPELLSALIDYAATAASYISQVARSALADNAERHVVAALLHHAGLAADMERAGWFANPTAQPEGETVAKIAKVARKVGQVMTWAACATQVEREWAQLVEDGGGNEQDFLSRFMQSEQSLRDTCEMRQVDYDDMDEYGTAKRLWAALQHDVLVHGNTRDAVMTDAASQAEANTSKLHKPALEALTERALFLLKVCPTTPPPPPVQLQPRRLQLTRLRLLPMLVQISPTQDRSDRVDPAEARKAALSAALRSCMSFLRCQKVCPTDLAALADRHVISRHQLLTALAIVCKPSMHYGADVPLAPLGLKKRLARAFSDLWTRAVSIAKDAGADPTSRLMSLRVFVSALLPRDVSELIELRSVLSFLSGLSCAALSTEAGDKRMGVAALAAFCALASKSSQHPQTVSCAVAAACDIVRKTGPNPAFEALSVLSLLINESPSALAALSRPENAGSILSVVSMADSTPPRVSLLALKLARSVAAVALSGQGASVEGFFTSLLATIGRCVRVPVVEPADHAMEDESAAQSKAKDAQAPEAKKARLADSVVGDEEMARQCNLYLVHWPAFAPLRMLSDLISAVAGSEFLLEKFSLQTSVSGSSTTRRQVCELLAKILLERTKCCPQLLRTAPRSECERAALMIIQHGGCALLAYASDENKDAAEVPGAAVVERSFTIGSRPRSHAGFVLASEGVALARILLQDKRCCDRARIALESAMTMTSSEMTDVLLGSLQVAGSFDEPLRSGGRVVVRSSLSADVREGVVSEYSWGADSAQVSMPDSTPSSSSTQQRFSSSSLLPLPELPFCMDAQFALTRKSAEALLRLVVESSADPDVTYAAVKSLREAVKSSASARSIILACGGGSELIARLLALSSSPLSPGPAGGESGALTYTQLQRRPTEDLERALTYIGARLWELPSPLETSKMKTMADVLPHQRQASKAELLPTRLNGGRLIGVLFRSPSALVCEFFGSASRSGRGSSSEPPEAFIVGDCGIDSNAVSEYYFELTIENTPEGSSTVSIGFCAEGQTGWNPGPGGSRTWRLQSTGKTSAVSPANSSERPEQTDYCRSWCARGATIGALWATRSRTLTFTRDGKALGVAFRDVRAPSGSRLVPAISICRGVRVRVNFGATPFRYQARAGDSASPEDEARAIEKERREEAERRWHEYEERAAARVAAAQPIVGMGYPLQRALYALGRTGNTATEAAALWLIEHDASLSDADVQAFTEEERRREAELRPKAPAEAAAAAKPDEAAASQAAPQPAAAAAPAPIKFAPDGSSRYVLEDALSFSEEQGQEQSPQQHQRQVVSSWWEEEGVPELRRFMEHDGFSVHEVDDHVMQLREALRGGSEADARSILQAIMPGNAGLALLERLHDASNASTVPFVTSNTVRAGDWVSLSATALEEKRRPAGWTPPDRKYVGKRGVVRRVERSGVPSALVVTTDDSSAVVGEYWAPLSFLEPVPVPSQWKPFLPTTQQAAVQLLTLSQEVLFRRHAGMLALELASDNALPIDLLMSPGGSSVGIDDVLHLVGEQQRTSGADSRDAVRKLSLRLKAAVCANEQTSLVLAEKAAALLRESSSFAASATVVACEPGSEATHISAPGACRIAVLFDRQNASSGGNSSGNAGSVSFYEDEQCSRLLRHSGSERDDGLVSLCPVTAPGPDVWVRTEGRSYRVTAAPVGPTQDVALWLCSQILCCPITPDALRLLYDALADYVYAAPAPTRGREACLRLITKALRRAEREPETLGKHAGLRLDRLAGLGDEAAALYESERRRKVKYNSTQLQALVGVALAAHDAIVAILPDSDDLRIAAEIADALTSSSGPSSEAPKPPEGPGAAPSALGAMLANALVSAVAKADNNAASPAEKEKPAAESAGSEDEESSSDAEGASAGEEAGEEEESPSSQHAGVPEAAAAAAGAEPGEVDADMDEMALAIAMSLAEAASNAKADQQQQQQQQQDSPNPAATEPAKEQAAPGEEKRAEEPPKDQQKSGEGAAAAEGQKEKKGGGDDVAAMQVDKEAPPEKPVRDEDQRRRSPLGDLATKQWFREVVEFARLARFLRSNGGSAKSEQPASPDAAPMELDASHEGQSAEEAAQASPLLRGVFAKAVESAAKSCALSSRIVVVQSVVLVPRDKAPQVAEALKAAVREIALPRPRAEPVVMPVDEATGQTVGTAFIEFASGSKAAAVAARLGDSRAANTQCAAAGSTLRCAVLSSLSDKAVGELFASARRESGAGPVVTLEDVMAVRACAAEDERLVARVDEAYAEEDVPSPAEYPLDMLEPPSLRPRLALLKQLNSYAPDVLPLSDLAAGCCACSSSGCLGGCEAGEEADEEGRGGDGDYGGLAWAVRACRSMLFHNTKLAFSHDVFDKTASGAPAPVVNLERLRLAERRTKPNFDPSLLQNSLFGSAWKQLQYVPAWQLRRRKPAGAGEPHCSIKVLFRGENVEGEGGPYRQLFTEVAKELQGPAASSPLFVPCPNAQTKQGNNRDKYMPRPAFGSPHQLELYRFVGRLMGVAMRTGVYLALNLPAIVWKLVVGAEAPTLADLRDVDECFWGHVEYVSHCDRDALEGPARRIFERMCTTLSDKSPCELVPGGADREVTYENRAEYVRLVELARLNECSRQAAAMRHGLVEIVPEGLLRVLTWRDVERSVCGRAFVDVQMLRRHTVYGAGLSPDAPHVRAFWDVLAELSQQDLRQFVRFAWAQERLPADDREYEQTGTRLMIKPSPRIADPDRAFPRADTCFFNLMLPEYSSREVLRERLLTAVRSDSDSMDADTLHSPGEQARGIGVVDMQGLVFDPEGDDDGEGDDDDGEDES
eukprot:m51a1_g3985 putative hect domain and rcc1-like domain-containing protein (3401) ;mRNA; f:470235-483438